MPRKCTAPKKLDTNWGQCKTGAFLDSKRKLSNKFIRIVFPL